MSPRRVLFVSFTGALGGAERVLAEWAAAVGGHTVLACPPGALAEADAAGGVERVTLPERPLRRRGRSGRAALDLAALGRDVSRLVRRIRPAVIVASGQRPLLAAAPVPLHGARLLALQHDLPANGLARALVAAAASRAATVVATSATVARALPAGAQVIHPGVDLGRWEMPAPAPGPPRALVLGALVPIKRPDLALEIAARVPDLLLDVAGAPLPGDGSAFETELRARAARADLSGRVRFLGSLEDPRAAMAEAHLLLHCGEREGFGLAVVEALAAGRPVVAPAAGGATEIVTPASGRLFAPGDADAGAAAVRDILSDPHASLAARERAAAFDGAAAARGFAAIVDRIAPS